jgi:transposase
MFTSCLLPEDMDRRMLTDAQWLRIADLLPGKATDKGRTAADNRRFVEAVLHIARMGCPWRDMPKEFGNWHSTYVRFARWEAGGVWNRIALSLQGEADLEELFIDATIVRAHQHAAGARKKTMRIRTRPSGAHAAG